ncbi:MAG: type II toxin-antitoxin system Phd/YefM family antitoxin [Ruminococcus sp.]|nr:type II toxin-antitoxin system Phd/YefM family antitoxin [Ruminococcus sp.]
MMTIKFEDFCNNYDLFVKLCEMTSEPMKISRNGRTDLVVISAEAYERRKKMLDLREKLLRVSDDEPFGDRGISLEELGRYLTEIESGK